MPTDSLYVTRDVGDVTAVSFQQTQMLDAMTIERMGTTLKQLIEGKENGRFVFDFSSVTYMSSSALGMLIGLQRRILQEQSQLKLCGIRDDIMEVFHITKLDTVFDIYKDAHGAIEAFRKNL